MDEPVAPDVEILLAMLVHLTRRRPVEWIMLGDLLHAFDYSRDRFADLEGCVEWLEANALIVSLEANDMILRTFLRITLAGRAYLNARYGEQGDLVLFRSGASPPERLVGEMPNARAIDSATWTAKSARRFSDPHFIEDLRRRLAELDRDIQGSELGNFEKACAISVSKALLALIESPQPEWQLMADLLRSQAFGASLAILGLAQFILAMIV